METKYARRPLFDVSNRPLLSQKHSSSLARVIRPVFCPSQSMHADYFDWMFADISVGSVFLVLCLLYRTNPNPRKKYLLIGKSGPKATFNLFFSLGWVGLGLGSSSVSYYVLHICFPTQQWVVNGKHPIVPALVVY